MIHEDTRLTLNCDRDGCTAKFRPTPINEWSPCVLADQARARGWAVRDHPFQERHLCPTHTPPRSHRPVDHRPLTVAGVPINPMADTPKEQPR